MDLYEMTMQFQKKRTKEDKCHNNKSVNSKADRYLILVVIDGWLDWCFLNWLILELAVKMWGKEFYNRSIRDCARC